MKILTGGISILCLLGAGHQLLAHDPKEAAFYMFFCLVFGMISMLEYVEDNQDDDYYL